MKKILIIMSALLSFSFAGLRDKPTDTLPDGYINGAQLSWVDGYTIHVGTTNEKTTWKESDNHAEFTYDDYIVLNLTNSNVAGALNGIARGITFVSNTLYYVYLCTRKAKPYSNATYTIYTTNATAPEFPTNSGGVAVLDAYRRVGSFITWGTNATVQAVPFTQAGKGKTRVTQFASTEESIGSFLPNTGSNTTYTAISPVVSTDAVEIIGSLITTNVVQFLPDTSLSIGVNGGLRFGLNLTADPNAGLPVVLPVKSGVTYYKSELEAAAATLYLVGWKEEL